MTDLHVGAAGKLGRRAFLSAGLTAGAAIGASLIGGQRALPDESDLPDLPDLRLTASDLSIRKPPTRWGVNYTPSRVWWDIWQKFDAHRVADDLAAIASLGVDHIRIQLLWKVFQPSPTGADPAMVRNLETMLDIAADHKLDVCPSVITSALSGSKFVPDWARGHDWIIEPELLEAQTRYIGDLGHAIGAHPRLLGFDLGNENLGQAPDHVSTHLANWARRLIHACRIAAPGKIHTVSPNGVFTVPYPEIVSTVGDLSVIHPWCFIGGSTQDGQIQHFASHHAEFNVEDIRSFHPFNVGARRHVWVQEVGAPRVNFQGQQVIPASLSADFLEQTVRSILTSEDVWGITWWCSHEIDPRRQSGRFNTPEYTLGLFGLAGEPKPMATRFASIIAESRANQIPALLPRRTAVVGSRADVFDALQLQGISPAIVQPNRVHDTAYLARRGITTLIH